MQTTISFTDQDDKASVADILRRMAAAFSPTQEPAAAFFDTSVDHPATPTGAPAGESAPAARRTRTKRPDVVETYNAMAAAAGAPAVEQAPPTETVAPRVEPIETETRAVTAAEIAAAGAKAITPAEAALAPTPEPQDRRKGLEASVLRSLNKAGMAWARENWPAGKPLRLGDFTDEELLALRTKADTHNDDEIPF